MGPLFASASGTVTIPIGGGNAALNITVTAFSVIDYVLDVKITAANPDVDDIYHPRGIKVTGNVVGLTLAAGTGTTLTVEVAVSGHP